MGWRRSRRPALKKQPNESNKLIWIQAQTLEVSVTPSAHMEAPNFHQLIWILELFFCGDAAEREQQCFAGRTSTTFSPLGPKFFKGSTLLQSKLQTNQIQLQHHENNTAFTLMKLT